MRLASSLILVFAAGAGLLSAGDGDVTFKSDVSLVRLDAQVVDRDGRSITGLQRGDFILTQNGRRLDVRNFASEDMPVDVLLLMDVSGSMRSHVQRMADASHDALRVLGRDDRVAVMVFDRATRVRLPFSSDRGQVERAFESLLRRETFNGGTDITRALLDATEYMRRSARKEARRAIVIMTDDQTERDRDESLIESQMGEADTVLSAIIAPNAMRNGGYGQYPQGGGRRGNSWPRGSSLPGIIWGGGMRLPGGGGGPYPQGGGMGSHTRSAGTSEIARQTGGDSMSINDASAFETTLARIRQRYALYFQLPGGTRAGEEHNVQIALAQSALTRYPGAEVRYRGNYRAPNDLPADAGGDPAVISQSQAPAAGSGDGTAAQDEPAPRPRRRVVLDDSATTRGPNPNVGAAADTGGGWGTSSSTTAQPAPASTATTGKKGWRRADPSDLTPAESDPSAKKK